MTTRTKKPVAGRIEAKAIRTELLAMCGDGLRRDSWKGVLLVARQAKIVLRRVFHIEAEALAYAERQRQRHIAADRMPETMIERQRREDEEYERANA